MWHGKYVSCHKPGDEHVDQKYPVILMYIKIYIDFSLLLTVLFYIALCQYLYESPNIHNMQITHLEKVVLPSNPSTIYSSNTSIASKITSAFFPETAVMQNRELSKPKPVSPLKLCHGTKHREWWWERESWSCETEHTVHIFNLQLDLTENKHKICSIVRLPRHHTLPWALITCQRLVNRFPKANIAPNCKTT